jgi:hypothetical protein
MMNITKNKFQVLLISSVFLSTNLIYSTTPATECAHQFNTNKDAVDVMHIQQTLNCVPGPGSVLGMLDPLDSIEVIDDWFKCIKEVDEGYNEAMDMLADTMFECMEAAGADFN